MRTWTRWQDWGAVIVGAYALLSPLWVTTVTEATWTMVVLGALTALAGLWSLAKPDNVFSDGVIAVLGVLFFVSPWVLSFTATTAIARTAWVVGILAFALGAWAWPESNRLHHRHAVASH